ncbi:MAG: DEAD/DEAH box helicase [Actinobacteria bacterium]|nr:DEAD/DEAH box helicase [Actinomycetota bacterium]
MNDPIGTFETIRDNFIRYVRTAFHIRNKEIDRERTTLLKMPDLSNNSSPALYRTPWVEPIPRYKSMGRKFSDLSFDEIRNAAQVLNKPLPSWFNQKAFERFKGLVSQGLFDRTDMPLYKHQFEMLVRALCGESLVITTGTGSGKTESFLLPIFAWLASETLRQEWMHPIQVNPLRDDWWGDSQEAAQWRNTCKNGNAFARSPRICQREGESGRAAVRAMIIYPMNALVEDQMSRLRKSLDSQPARAWQEKNLGSGQRIYFGRYNSETPVSGHEFLPSRMPNVKKITQLRNRLREAEASFNKAVDYDLQKNQGREEARFFFPSVVGSEMRSRWDMEKCPPDIFVTNFSMLSVMLMREADQGIFDETKRWLEKDPRREHDDPERIFHLVIDELHLYRGTAGTETAYLIRLLLHRLGLKPSSAQLRVLASSASLTGDPQTEEGQKSARFLEEFFGKPGIGIIKGDIDVPQATTPLNHGPFITLANGWISRSKRGLKGHVLEQALDAEFEAVAVALGGQAMVGQGVNKLIATLTDPTLAPRISDQFLHALLEQPRDPRGGHFRAHDLLEFGRRIFGNRGISRKSMMLAIRGLLIARGSTHRNDVKDDLPTLRFHWFFRNLEGLWASPDPKDIDPASVAVEDHMGGENPEDEEHEDFYHQGEDAGQPRNVGRLYASPKALVTEAGNRVLELLYCEQCGEVMLGGIRLGKEDDTDFYLMANEQELEKVPEIDRPLLAKDRKYSDYGIFWPGESLSDLCPKWTNQQGQEDSRANTVKNSWGQDAVVYEAPRDESTIPGTPLAGWVKSHLFPKTGRVCQFGIINGENAISGYVYRLGYFHHTAHPIGNYDYRAFPAVCPSCGEDYRYQTTSWNLNKKKSPIRTFRTGFTKISQVFAKELFKEIPDGDQGRKLIVFSDSREDAAKISNDIERFHYGDMIREIIYGDLHAYLLGGADYLDHLQRDADLTKPASDYATLFAVDAGKLRQAVIIMKNLEHLTMGQQTPEQRAQYYEANRFTLQKRDIATKKTIPLSGLYDGNDPILIKRLKNLGINPAGYGKMSQRYKSYGRPTVEAEWHQLLDFNSDENLYRSAIAIQGAVFQSNVIINPNGYFIAIIRQRILEQLFGKLFYGIESSALGYVAVQADDTIIKNAAAICNLPPDYLREACRSVVRLLGEKFNYEQKDSLYGGPTTITDRFGSGRFSRTGKFHTIYKYAEKICRKHNVILEDLQQALSDVINSVNLGNVGWVLSANSLELKLSSPTDPYWKCNACGKVHLHPSAGVCCHCFSDLDPKPCGQCNEIYQNNYYASMVSGGSGPFRLHTEELTGQTDDQPSRQRNFRNIVLNDDGPECVKTIDLLSVTTTMEVGIDIGGLSVVMQANMPPERFNYQQRAGRGGRRGQPYSAVMTLCRQRSHDTIHFENPLDITGAPAPTPFLAMDQEEIARRVMSKGVLRKAFYEIGVRWHHGPTSSPDTHGEFGCRLSWNGATGNCGPLQQMLADPQMITAARDLAEALCAGLQGQNVTPQRLVDFVTQELMGRILHVMGHPEFESIDGVAHALSEGGVLPLLGMPSRVREMFHGPVRKWRDDDGQWHYELPSIERELELAVSDFAPKSQRTKDKRIHESFGICPPLSLVPMRGGDKIAPAAQNQYHTEVLWMARCNQCRYCHSYGADQPENPDQECPRCHADQAQGFQVLRLIVPAAFYTEDLKEGSDSIEGEESVSSPAARISDIDSNAAIAEVGLNVKRFCTKGRLYTLNDNKGKLFNGIEENNNLIRGKDDKGNPNCPNDNDISRWFSDTKGELCALAAPKMTDALVFRIDKVPSGIEASPIRPVPQGPGGAQALTRPGVKSALVSAAFLIRSAAADLLDIDPEEFDLCHVRLAEVQIDPTGRKKYSGEFILADHLINGSGFTRRLDQEFGNILRMIIQAADQQNSKSVIDKIFTKDHMGKCQSSCYSCLQNFRNMRYHPLLDWRLGISMVRMFVYPDFVAGLDGQWGMNGLNDWTAKTREYIDNFIQNFGSLVPRYPLQNSGPSGIKWRDNRGERIVIVRHPLWDTTVDRQGIFADWIAEAAIEVGEQNVRSVDSFDLFKRPAWVFRELRSDNAVFHLR